MRSATSSTHEVEHHRPRLLAGTAGLAVLQFVHLLDVLRYDEDASFPAVLGDPLAAVGVGSAVWAFVLLALRRPGARTAAIVAPAAVVVGFVLHHGIPVDLDGANNPYWTFEGGNRADWFRWVTVLGMLALGSWTATTAWRTSAPRPMAAVSSTGRRAELSAFMHDRVALLRLLGVVPTSVLMGLTFVMLLASMLPAATAIAVAWLVGRAAAAAAGRAGLGATAWPLALVGSLLTLDQVAQSMLVPFRNWVATRVNGEVRMKVRRAVSAPPGIDHLESQIVRDAATLPVDNAYLFNLGAGAEGQLWLLTRFAGAAAATAVVAAFSALAAAAVLLFVVWQRSLLRRHYAKAIATAMTGTTADGRASSYWSEIVGTPVGAKELRLFGFGDWAIERFFEHGSVPVRELSRVLVSAYRLHWTVFALNALSGLVPFLLLARLAVDGGLSGPELAAALGGVVAVARVLSAMGWEAFSIEASVPQLAAVERLEQFHGDEAAAARSRSRIVQTGTVPTIRFDGVSFAYPGATRTVLERLDLELRPGQSVAIVGENGAGKTTLLKLLAGFYQPTAGRILVDGHDLSGLDPVTWRQQLSVIFQEFVRFELSAFENVALADLDHPEAERHAEEAARAAGAAALIADMPRGWDTILSRGFTDGIELSGGQWQRIALARALYGARVGARVLILDEPTASLDVSAEVALFDQLLTQAHGSTAIVVSHRFSTVRRAERIVVLAGGRVVEDGSHTELHAAGGVYARLYDLQADRFRKDVAEEAVG